MHDVQGSPHELFSLMLLERLTELEKNADALGGNLRALNTRLDGLQRFIDKFHALNNHTECVTATLHQIEQGVTRLQDLVEMNKPVEGLMFMDYACLVLLFFCMVMLFRKSFH